MSGVCNLNISDHQLVYVIRKKNKNIGKKYLSGVDHTETMINRLLQLLLEIMIGQM